jgi:hypothetical protein
MNSITCKIESKHSIRVLLEKLQLITIEEQLFMKPKGVYFLGKVKGDSFKLITFNAPPMEFFFKVKEETLEFDFIRPSLSSTIKGLVYALLFPLFIALWLWALLDNDISTQWKIAATLLLVLPVILNKFYKVIYKEFVFADDVKFFKKLEVALDSKIERSPSHNTVQL